MVDVKICENEENNKVDQQNQLEEHAVCRMVDGIFQKVIIQSYGWTSLYFLQSHDVSHVDLTRVPFRHKAKAFVTVT